MTNYELLNNRRIVNVHDQPTGCFIILDNRTEIFIKSGHIRTSIPDKVFMIQPLNTEDKAKI